MTNPVPTPTSQTMAYVACADGREIQVLALDRQNGSLRLLQSVATGGATMPLALSPDRSTLYASLRSEPYTVAAYRIHPQSGLLTECGRAPLPDNMAYIATDASGRWLFAGSYGGHRISLSPLSTDGLPQAAKLVLPTGQNAHAVVPHPNNRYLYVPNLGSDQVLQWDFDADAGTLTPHTPPRWIARQGSGPRHLVLHPNGKHAYLLNELDATVDVLAVDPQDGHLTSIAHTSSLPPGFEGKPWAADLHLTPDGRFLYTSERTSSTLAIWAVSPADGLLTLVGHQATENQPRGFRIDSRGQWLMVAGQASHSVSLYRIDPSSGRLSLSTQLATAAGPNWIEIIDLE